MGTGRCGTQSLSNLIDTQPNSNATHEARPLLPFKKDMITFDKLCKTLHSRKKNIVCDVALYHIWYVDDFIEYFSDKDVDLSFVCLKRDKEKTVNSYLKKVPDPHNHWQIGKQSGHLWDGMYPKYDTDTKKEAVERYWENYYEVSEEFEKKYDNFKIYKTNDLNVYEGVKDILKHCGLEKEGIVRVGFKSNKLLSK